MRQVDRRELFALLTGWALSTRRLAAADHISVGMIPDAGATQVSIEQKAPLRSYLSNALGVPVDLVIPTNYNATVEALGNGSLDFAYLGALTYVKARERYGVLPLVQRALDKTFHSLFITASDSPVHSLADVRGRTFAFGDINSTSGHLIPYAELKQAGVDVDQAVKCRYTGSHPATAKAVEMRTADAGALDETVFKSLLADRVVDSAKIRIFHTSKPFLDYVWVARKDVDASIRERFAAAFLALKSGVDDAVLAVLRGRDFVRVDDLEYAGIRSIARDLKLM
jgi:phosphonate transport system substrate-binding protein